MQMGDAVLLHIHLSLLIPSSLQKRIQKTRPPRLFARGGSPSNHLPLMDSLLGTLWRLGQLANGAAFAEVGVALFLREKCERIRRC